MMEREGERETRTYIRVPQAVIHGKHEPRPISISRNVHLMHGCQVVEEIQRWPFPFVVATHKQIRRLWALSQSCCELTSGKVSDRLGAELASIPQRVKPHVGCHEL